MQRPYLPVLGIYSPLLLDTRLDTGPGFSSVTACDVDPYVQTFTKRNASSLSIHLTGKNTVHFEEDKPFNCSP